MSADAEVMLILDPEAMINMALPKNSSEEIAQNDFPSIGCFLIL